MLAGLPVAAAPEGPAGAPAGPARIGSSADESLDHRLQIGLGLRLGSGFRAIFPYSSQFCGQADQAVCSSRYPTWIELSPSFGVTKGLELLVDFRFFLENPDFTSATGLLVSPGIKYYADAESLLKFYLTGQIVFENQDQRVASNLSSFDFGLRSVMGVQVDLLRYVGLYAQAGVVFGFVRWFSFLADFSGGVQVRY